MGNVNSQMKEIGTHHTSTECSGNLYLKTDDSGIKRIHCTDCKETYILRTGN